MKKLYQDGLRINQHSESPHKRDIQSFNVTKSKFQRTLDNDVTGGHGVFNDAYIINEHLKDDDISGRSEYLLQNGMTTLEDSLEGSSNQKISASEGKRFNAAENHKKFVA